MSPSKDPLREAELLGDLSAERRRRLAEACGWQRYRNGEVILDREDTGSDLLFCIDGELEITTFSSSDLLKQSTNVCMLRELVKRSCDNQGGPYPVRQYEVPLTYGEAHRK